MQSLPKQPFSRNVASAGPAKKSTLAFPPELDFKAREGLEAPGLPGEQSRQLPETAAESASSLLT